MAQAIARLWRWNSEFLTQPLKHWAITIQSASRTENDFCSKAIGLNVLLTGDLLK
jgi:hypothetical protein